jgi:hypothetical protein
MYGVIKVTPAPGTELETRKYYVTGSATITKGDLVKMASGTIAVAGAGERVFGIANQTVIGNAGGTSEIEVILARPGVSLVMDNDNTGTTMAKAHEGTYFDITGTTGAMQVDTSTTTTTGQLMLLDHDPDPTDTSLGLYVVAESAHSI